MKTVVKASQQWNLFLEFLVGQILIILTGILLDMVLILFVYQMSQSLFETSAILIVGSVANVLGSVLLSNVIDKIPAKWVIMRTLILKIFIICLLALFYKNIYIVFLIKFLLSFLNSVISPAQGVLLAEITDDDRIRLNSIFYTVIQIFQTATWTLGIPIVLILKPFMTFCL
ncbi:MFS transporter, partial [Streptococcus sp. 10F2]